MHVARKDLILMRGVVMRRVLLAAIALLTLGSCFYRPAYLGEGQGGRSMPCREVSRSRCAADSCRGGNMDLVTYHCGGTRATTRCVANFGCSGR